ncbi:ras-related GTP-binding protein D-like protein [Chlamydoabsidia padenii]|nr:ras-related GTP-binding protein D-like protein [Chlamydoabsidia padenii]
MDFDYTHPSEYDTGDVIDDQFGSDKPRILLMGLQRSGKSSIQRVVFGKMPPNDTLYLESTTKIQREDITRSFIDFQIWDFPGQINFFDPAYDSLDIFESVGALIFVIDAQDDYSDALSRLFYTVTSAYKVNPNITFEVLLHKVDGLSDDYKIDTQRDVQQRMSDALQDAECDHIHLTYYLTSIYDHSIYEAFSKIIQKLIRELPTLENLLNVLCSNSGIDKAYLFDTLTKIYIATDSSPVDMQSYELCSDMIDVVIDIECIYGVADRTQNSTPNDQPSLLLDNGGDDNGGRKDKGELVQSPLSDDLDTQRKSNPDHNDPDNELQQRYNNGDQDSTTLNNGHSQQEPATENEASSLIKLDNGDVLYMREVNRLLVLICLLRQDNFEKHGLIDYNFQCFKEAVTEVFEFSQKRNTQQQQRSEHQLQVTETQQSQDTSRDS